MAEDDSEQWLLCFVDLVSVGWRKQYRDRTRVGHAVGRGWPGKGCGPASRLLALVTPGPGERGQLLILV